MMAQHHHDEGLRSEAERDGRRSDKGSGGGDGMGVVGGTWHL